jgi:hypothetical protein
MSEEEDGVPLGSWRRLYTAVLINLAVLMLLAGVFSLWPY